MLLWIQVGHDGQRMYRYLFCIFNKRSNQTVNHLNTVYFEQLVFFFHENFFYYIYIQGMQLLLACLDGFVGEECDTPLCTLAMKGTVASCVILWDVCKVNIILKLYLNYFWI